MCRTRLSDKLKVFATRCLTVQYVKICDKLRAFADSIKLLSQNKTAAESCQLLREAYGEHVPSQDMYANKEHGKSLKRYVDAELQALLNEDKPQTQKQFSEKDRQMGTT